MIVFPNSKLNLGLNVLRKTDSGYHDLETIFYPLGLRDALEIIEQKHYSKQQTPHFTSTGLPVPGKPASNLCVKAYRILKKEFPDLPAVQIHLHKIIPSGAGLGGGSADASFALKLINELFHLDIPDTKLMEYALELGSDCPFFILNKPCFASARGEKLEEIELDLSNYKFIIVNPGIHVDTGRAFMNIKPTIPEISLRELIRQPVERWKDNVCNDFESYIFSQHREIVDLKDYLYSQGAIYASMSGSGSTVYGIYPKGKELNLSFPVKYFVSELDGN
jgi:4-diphosphocytidyl-2-C-methyl-D-erythritol kinase